MMNEKEEKLKDILLSGLKALTLTLTGDKIQKLVAYIVEFEKWNKAYNLSAVRNVEQMVVRHLLDSLTVVPFIEGNNIVDVGTGGGLPGVPLAICFPEKNFTLVDSNGKKTRFVFHVKNLLKIDNIDVQNVRVETLGVDTKFDAVISRAFASLKDMTDNCQHLLTPEGVFLAMKGVYPEQEIAAIYPEYMLDEVYSLKVPGDAAERHLLKIRHNVDALACGGAVSTTQ